MEKKEGKGKDERREEERENQPGRSDAGDGEGGQKGGAEYERLWEAGGHQSSCSKFPTFLNARLQASSNTISVFHETRETLL